MHDLLEARVDRELARLHRVGRRRGAGRTLVPVGLGFLV